MVDSLAPYFDIVPSDDALPAGPLIAAPRDPHVCNPPCGVPELGYWC